MMTALLKYGRIRALEKLGKKTDPVNLAFASTLQYLLEKKCSAFDQGRMFASEEKRQQLLRWANIQRDSANTASDSRLPELVLVSEVISVRKLLKIKMPALEYTDFIRESMYASSQCLKDDIDLPTGECISGTISQKCAQGSSYIAVSSERPSNCPDFRDVGFYIPPTKEIIIREQAVDWTCGLLRDLAHFTPAGEKVREQASRERTRFAQQIVLHEQGHATSRTVLDTLVNLQLIKDVTGVHKPEWLVIGTPGSTCSELLADYYCFDSLERKNELENVRELMLGHELLLGHYVSAAALLQKSPAAYIAEIFTFMARSYVSLGKELEYEIKPVPQVLKLVKKNAREVLTKDLSRLPFAFDVCETLK